MKCPTCNVDLVMSERQGIEIDYCPQCRGVWLDRGELDKIIERSAATTAPPPAPPAPQAPTTYPQASQPYRQEEYDHHGHGYKKHRKKSFFEELFD
jgi:uncharacterized protein